jgi:hypothetical protein
VPNGFAQDPVEARVARIAPFEDFIMRVLADRIELANRAVAALSR